MGEPPWRFDLQPGATRAIVVPAIDNDYGKFDWHILH
jgi:hypothetical protein